MSSRFLMGLLLGHIITRNCRCLSLEIMRISVHVLHFFEGSRDGVVLVLSLQWLRHICSCRPCMPSTLFIAKVLT